MGNKSNTEKEYDRRTILATYLYDVSKLSKFFAENSNKKINYYGILFLQSLLLQDGAWQFSFIRNEGKNGLVNFSF